MTTNTTENARQVAETFAKAYEQKFNELSMTSGDTANIIKQCKEYATDKLAQAIQQEVLRGSVEASKKASMEIIDWLAENHPAVAKELIEKLNTLLGGSDE